MSTFNNILYVSEPTVDQVASLTKAIALARQQQANLTVLEVVPRVKDKLNPLPKGVDVRALEHELVLDVEKRLAELIDAVTEDKQIHIKVTVGKVTLETLHLVEKNGYDLVMKPVENPNWLTRIFGSDDMHLIRHSPCPVWLIKGDAEQRYQAVMTALDYDAAEPEAALNSLNQKMLDLSADIAVSDEVALHVVHCWQPPDEMLYRAWGNLDEQRSRNYVLEEQQAHRDGLQTLAEFLRRNLLNNDDNTEFAHFHLIEGAPETSIPEAAEKLKVDLLVIGSVARTGIQGLLIGNTAEAVLEQVNCSVLVVKPTNSEHD
jgi:nucleotide-binding universal stress UspA family protein